MPPMEFKVETRDESGVPVVAIHGSLSDDPIEAARDEVMRGLEGSPAHLIVDLTNVDYISSSGIGMLVGAQKASRAASVGLVLCGLNADLQELFALTRLNQIFTIAEDLKSWQQSVPTE